MYEKKINIKVPALSEYLEAIRKFVSSLPAIKNLTKEEQYNLLLAVEEACENVVTHAYPDKEYGEIKIELKSDNEKITIIVVDKGKGFVPTEKVDIDNAIELKVRGLGIYIIEKLMDEVSFNINEKEGGTKIKMSKYLKNK